MGGIGVFAIILTILQFLLTVIHYILVISRLLLKVNLKLHKKAGKVVKKVDKKVNKDKGTLRKGTSKVLSIGHDFVNTVGSAAISILTVLIWVTRTLRVGTSLLIILALIVGGVIIIAVLFGAAYLLLLNNACSPSSNTNTGTTAITNTGTAEYNSSGDSSTAGLGEVTDEARAFVKNMKFFYLGDSIGEGATDGLKSAFPGMVINADIGRSLVSDTTLTLGRDDNGVSGLDVLRNNKEKIKELGHLVVALGTNDGQIDSDSSSIEEVFNIVGNDVQVTWVLSASQGGGNGYNSINIAKRNEAIKSVLAKHSNAKYISFENWVSKNGSWSDLTSDSIHLNSTGNTKYVDMHIQGMYDLYGTKVSGNSANIEETTSSGIIKKHEEGYYYFTDKNGKNHPLVNKEYGTEKDWGGEDAEAKAKFDEFRAAMRNAGYEIGNGYSGYRSIETQRTLYNNYVAQDGQEKADTYSAKPGSSEHHTGLAFDLNASTENLYDGKNGNGTSEGVKWIEENAPKYGFIVRYKQEWQPVTGYVGEEWHLRYLGTELAQEVAASGKPLETFVLENLDINTESVESNSNTGTTTSQTTSNGCVPVRDVSSDNTTSTKNSYRGSNEFIQGWINLLAKHKSSVVDGAFTGIDTDGSYGSQCWDLVNYYINYFVTKSDGSAMGVTYSGNAVNTGDVLGAYSDLFESAPLGSVKVSDLQPGDILYGTGWVAEGHVGIVIEVYDDGSIAFLDQNTHRPSFRKVAKPEMAVGDKWGYVRFKPSGVKVNENPEEAFFNDRWPDYPATNQGVGQTKWNSPVEGLVKIEDL